MSLTKIGSIGINTGIQLAGVTTVSTLHVGSGVTLSSDGDGFYTGVVTATTFSGALAASNLTGALPAVSGANITNLNASNLASGTVPTARLGSGTASSSTFLRGDSTFQTVNTDLVSDTSPQLGGTLDANGNNIEIDDGNFLKFGGTGLTIRTNANNAYITEGTSGKLEISASNLQLSNAASSKTYAYFTDGGAATLYHNGNERLTTSSTGVLITGTDDGDGGAKGDFKFMQTDGTLKAMFDASASALEFYDNSKAIFGDGDDMQLYHDGTTNYIECGASNFAIRVNSGNRLEINGTSGDVIMQGTSGRNFQWDNSAAYLNLNDNARLTLGDSNDLFMYHNGSNTIFNQDGTGSLFFQKGGANKFYVQSGGAQFVGTLYGDDNNQIQLGDSQDFKLYHNGTNAYIDADTSGSLYIRSNVNNAHIFLKKAGGGDVRVLDSSNNESNIFESGGALRFLGSQSRSANNTNSIMSNNGNSLDFGGSEYMYFRINGTERARFQTSNNGYFQIGRSGNTPANAQLGVAVSNSVCAIQTISDGSSGHEHIRFNNTNGEVGRITTSGGGTTYYTSSDYRLKENDVAISDGVARVKQLRPIKFNWKSNPSETVDGFFAHEVQAIVPEAVDRSKDQVVTQADIDEEKFKQDELGDPLYQAYDASRLVPLLTAAVKELITRVENLESA